MDIRGLFQEKPIVGIAFATALVLLSAWMVSRQRHSGAATFYDLQSGELFSYDEEELPPITAPSGGQGVWAHVFACGSCDDDDARFIGYLEKYTEEGKAQVKRTAEALAASSRDQPPAPQPSRPEPGRVISAVVEDGEVPQWIEVTDPKAARIVAGVRDQCDETKVVRCDNL